jgi:CheY-like chemotaxis protein
MMLSSATKTRVLPVSLKFSGTRVLVIEDEDYNRYITEVVLGKLGMSVVWARTGQEALSRTDYGNIDLILIDWLLPDMEAPQIIQEVSNVCKSSTPPVVVVSGFSDHEKKLDARRAGAAAFVTKPIDPFKLVAALETFGFTPPSRRNERLSASPAFAAELFSDGENLSKA